MNQAHAGLAEIILMPMTDESLEEQYLLYLSKCLHELRTPLTTLKVRYYLLNKEPEAFDDHLAALGNGIDQLNRLVEDLFNFSCLQHGGFPMNRRWVALQDLLETVTQANQPRAEQKNIDLVCDQPDSPVHLFADPDRVIQVIGNLVDNAIRHTYETGKITVRLSIESSEDNADAYAVVYVQDNGFGIKPGHLAHIFEPFYQARHMGAGSGLGLSIAKEIVEAHHGHIEVESFYGVGSTFAVWLPLESPS